MFQSIVCFLVQVTVVNSRCIGQSKLPIALFLEIT